MQETADDSCGESDRRDTHNHKANVSEVEREKSEPVEEEVMQEICFILSQILSNIEQHCQANGYPSYTLLLPYLVAGV